MPLPLPPVLPHSIRDKFPKVFAFSDLLGYIMSHAHADDTEDACEILGEIAAIHTHHQPVLAHRRVCVDGVMMTILASIPTGANLTPEYVRDLLAKADAEQEKHKARSATN